MGNGLFMPDNFVPHKATLTDVKLVSIAWGWLLGFSFLTAAKAGTQTLQIWRRIHRLTAYILMIWLEIVACSILGLISWLFMHGTFSDSFAFYFVGTTLRCVIVQLILQIVVNRISILVTNQRLKTFLKWGPFTLILLLNIGVYCIWIPTHLQISQAYMEINRYYSRCEKVTYTLVDIALNVYFCHLVKNRLIKAGMSKYRALFKFNVFLILVNLSMDVLLIGMMSLPNQLAYVSFFPLTYMVKLNIEMSMAEMIAKVAKGSNEAYHTSPRSQCDSFGVRGTKRKSAGSSTGSVELDEHKSLHGSIGKTRNLNPLQTRSPLQNRRFTQSIPANNNLYHAWISGGMSSQAHLALNELDHERSSRSADLDMQSGTMNRNSDARRSWCVITKDTVVHVRAEDV